MDEVSIADWSAWLTAEAKLSGWLVDEAGNRKHRATHVCLRDGRLVVLFARPRGGQLLTQHKGPHTAWSLLAAATERGRVSVFVVTPADRERIREILE